MRSNVATWPESVSTANRRSVSMLLITCPNNTAATRCRGQWASFHGKIGEQCIIMPSADVKLNTRGPRIRTDSRGDNFATVDGRRACDMSKV